MKPSAPASRSALAAGVLAALALSLGACDKQAVLPEGGPAATRGTEGGGGADGESARASTTNVVLLVADDLGYFDIGAYGNDFVETPNLDRMAAEGIRFSESYASGAVCSPSRAAIQTGLTPARLGITEHFHGPTQPQPWMRVIPPDNEPNLATRYTTVAEDLRRAGIARRLHIGKWHAGSNGPIAHGYSGIYGGSGGYWLNSQYHWPYWNGVDPNGSGPYAEVVRDSEPGDYLTDVLTDRALREVAEAVAADEPFFLHVDFYAPHVPIDGKPALVAKYEAKKASGTYTVDMDPHYAAMVETIDANVGRILDTLTALGAAANTVVIFTSDNGGLADRENPPFDPHTPATDNGPLRAGKGHLYEGGTRVPTLAWGGPVAGGRVSEAYHLGHDLYPTIFELVTGAPTATQTDGRSLAEHYRGAGDSDAEDRPVLWHYPHYSNQGGVPRSSLRQGAYKVIYDWGDSTTQLYNVRGDLGERMDLAGCGQGVVDSLGGMLRAALEAQGAKLPVPNPDFGG